MRNAYGTVGVCIEGFGPSGRNAWKVRCFRTFFRGGEQDAWKKTNTGQAL